jgi:glycosyltransferase involved in cell wall biosynthesis
MTIHKKACFLTTVYPSPFESRIFHREAKALAEFGYQVVLITQHHREEVVDGIRIVPLPKPKNRLDRMTRLTMKAMLLALREAADVYHLHSPELIPLGLLLKLLNRRVIYDAHEAFSEKILSKDWIPSWLRPLVSKAFGIFESLSTKCFDHVLTADAFTRHGFNGKNVTVLANYPLLELVSQDKCKTRQVARRTVLVYVGGLARDRGLHVMLEMMELLNSREVELHLLGNFEHHEDEEIVKKLEYVKYLGFVPLAGVYGHLAECDIGLALFQPVPAYFYAGENTNKLFEYMASGLPVVGSDFPNLKKIIEGNQCGICVNPSQPKEVARAVSLLCEDSQTRIAYGENGRRAVFKEYNWRKERQVLLDVYNRVLQG